MTFNYILMYCGRKTNQKHHYLFYRTFTNTIKPTADPASIAPTSSKPLFQTETIPAPENILTSSGPEYTNADLTDLSSSIETLPAIIIASQTHATPGMFYKQP